MLRFRFSSGVVLGVLLGVPVGVALSLFLAVPPAREQSVLTSLQLQELLRKVDAVRDDRERVERQLEQFRAVSDRIGSELASLDQQVRSLHAVERPRDDPPATAKPLLPTPAPTTTAGGATEAAAEPSAPDAPQ